MFKEHPRMSGEYLAARKVIFGICGPPPQARGILKEILVAVYWHGTTPACAGNTTLAQFMQLFRAEHPRLRGEYRSMVSPPVVLMGTPPLARGIPR